MHQSITRGVSQLCVNRGVVGGFSRRYDEVRSDEVRRACDELVGMIENYPRDNSREMRIDAEAVANFKAHYARLMYSAVLQATRKTFEALKKRLGSRTSGGFLFVERPFFDVNVELAVPHVVLNPSLEDIQRAVNNVAKKVLKVSLEITRWGNTDLNGDDENVPGVDYDKQGTASFYDEIASDIEIVKIVLLLTGSIEGLKKEVQNYVKTYSSYDFLYLKNLQQEYADFVSQKPSLDAFELELKKYMMIEQEVLKFPPVHNIGALSLETQPLKLALKAEAAAWKIQFAKNLHKHGNDQLKNIVQYMRDTTLKLNRKVEDLEDVRLIMEIQQDIRSKEAEIDTIMTPIEEIYALLSRCGGG